jgi:acyl-CoA thioester hydrolase
VVAFAARGSDEGGSVVDTGLLVARSEIEYLAPLVYRTIPVAIDLWVTSISAASFDMGYEVLDEDSIDGNRPQVYARAETTLVLFDLTTDRPRRMSEKERLTLQDWQDRPVRWRKRRVRAS